MTNDLLRWLEENSPAAIKRRRYEFLHMLEGKSPADPKFAEVLRDILRRSDDKMLGQIWREWKDGGRTDLALEVEREMERRKSRSVDRH